MDQSQSRERSREAPAKARTKERTQERPAERTDPKGYADAMGQKARSQQRADATPAVTMEEAVVTVGQNGAKNINVVWIDVWIGNAKPCRFDVSTLPGHNLEVVVEQLAYKKIYTGVGALSTQPVPVVPIGTRFTIVSTDTTTGEILEQKGIWRNMGGGGSSSFSLWSLIKKLLWKSG